jgi:hypothetical protein
MRREEQKAKRATAAKRAFTATPEGEFTAEKVYITRAAGGG